MTKKLSINIDLRASKHVNHLSVVTNNDDEHGNYNKVPVEFSYHYDRVFAVTLVIIVLVIALYFLTSELSRKPDISPDVVPWLVKDLSVQNIIKEKHLLASPENQTISQQNQRPVFLYYETINILEKFHVDQSEDPITDVIEEPITEVTDKPITEVTDKPITEVTDESITEVTDEPITEVTDEPITEVSDKSTIEVSDESITEVSDEPIIEVAQEPTIEVAEELTIEVAEEPAIEVAEEPAIKVAEEPIIEVVEEPIIEVAEEPIIEVVEEPIIDATEEPAIEVVEESTTEVIEQQSALLPNDHKSDFIKIFSNKLSRVKLVSNIYKKEPVNELSYLVTGPEDRAEKVYLFTQLDNSNGNTIEHQWWYDGKIISRKKFTALGDRWRCYSSKNIGKFQQGKWLLKVIDQNEKLLSTINFKYQIN